MLYICIIAMAVTELCIAMNSTTDDEPTDE